jgi:hypothetical protein
MGRRWTIAAAFVGGLVVGGAGGSIFVGEHWKRNFWSSYVMGLADQANVAREIHSGRGPELAKRITDSLPEYVRAVTRNAPRAEGADWALWMVSDVYKAAGIEPPPELRTVFASLPARRTCKPPAPGGNVQGAPG